MALWAYGRRLVKIMPRTNDMAMEFSFGNRNEAAERDDEHKLVMVEQKMIVCCLGVPWKIHFQKASSNISFQWREKFGLHFYLLVLAKNILELVFHYARGLPF